MRILACDAVLLTRTATHRWLPNLTNRASAIDACAFVIDGVLPFSAVVFAVAPATPPVDAVVPEDDVVAAAAADAVVPEPPVVVVVVLVPVVPPVVGVVGVVGVTGTTTGAVVLVNVTTVSPGASSEPGLPIEAVTDLPARFGVPTSRSAGRTAIAETTVAGVVASSVIVCTDMNGNVVGAAGPPTIAHEPASTVTLDVPTVKLKAAPAATPAPAVLQIFSVHGGAAMFVYVTIVVPEPTMTPTERVPSFSDPATIRPVGLTVMPPSGTIVPALIASATDTVVP
jgi:hypothetical protein